MDASVSLKIAETAELDDTQVRAHQTPRRRHAGSVILAAMSMTLAILS
jgi:hypothetical protein